MVFREMSNFHLRVFRDGSLIKILREVIWQGVLIYFQFVTFFVFHGQTRTQAGA